MASAGRSSLAPLLLVIAVLAGTCAPGAFAAGTTVVVTNGCPNLILISAALKLPVPLPVSLPTIDIEVGANAVATVKLALLLDFLDFIKLTISGKVYTIPAADIVAKIGNFAAIVGIEVLCNAPTPCGHTFITVKITANVLGKVVTAVICIPK